MAGSFIHTLAVTDVATGWVEAVPLPARDQRLVAEALGVIAGRLPVPLPGIDSDNNNAFISQALIGYCRGRGIQVTRSRAYRSNDQAYIEQKNGAVVCGFAGHERFAGPIAGQALARLFTLVGFYTNCFQPSAKLLSRERDGSRLAKRYDQPKTPRRRMLEHPAVPARAKEELRDRCAALDPLALLARVRRTQSALAALASPQERSQVQKGDLAQFLARPSTSGGTAKPIRFGGTNGIVPDGGGPAGTR